MTFRFRFLAALCACLFAACASRGPVLDEGPARASVLLVSLDGFRADYLDLGITPNLARLAREGARAQWMTPSYPSLTFPNHYSIVTGQVPDRHGIVHNTMRDPALGSFKLSDRAAVGNGDWWGGEPIWVSAEKAGLRTGTMYWPGSEAAIDGVRPAHWRVYSDEDALPLDARVDTVLGWLSGPDSARVHFATLYFEQIDKAAHDYGPDSPQAHVALRAVDHAMGRLLDGVAKRGARDLVDIVVVSDHGMATVLPGHAIAVEDMVSMQEATVVSIGQVIGIAPKAGFEARVERRLLGRHPHYACWRKDGLPQRWRYGAHPRVPPIVCQMDEGWDMIPRASLARRPAHARGSHGYDPALPSMRALFVARGPSFRQGVTLAPFDNVDVYPLLARLVGIDALPNDGEIAPLLPALRSEDPKR